MDYSASEIINKVVNHKKMTGGAIVLMHTGAKHTGNALDEMISKLKEKGYGFVTSGDIIYKDNFYINHEGKQIKKVIKDEAVQVE
ncbi:MAG TPA: hypothetical protein DCP90_05075 [Clostridiales bacterium]|nr:MAG: hypothetical protein A2Y22_07100 [Clostridiales bacterium GWD2_32_59]HAN09971.1 hypothetical protein [Clostridiales bacterium]